MSSYRTTFSQPLVNGRHPRFTRKTPNEKIEKTQQYMEKRFTFFLQNGDWEQALRMLMMNLKSRKNSMLEQRATRSVVTPQHFQRLLQFDSPFSSSSSSSSSSAMEQRGQVARGPTALAYFIRDQALSDDIPNSPELYSEIVKNFCQTHKRPKEALEVAVEGNARWRFDETEKKEMGMTILKQCARQKNCWSVACEVLQTLLLANDNETKISSRSISNSSSLMFPSSSTLSSTESKIIHDLLGEAAFRSGLWKSVVGRIESSKANTTHETKIEEKVERGEEEQEESEITNLWKACFTAAKEQQVNEALAIFYEAARKTLDSTLATNLNFKTNTNDIDNTISLNALHQLLNCLGAEGNWRESARVMDVWLYELDKNEITSLASNLFFSSFPSPFEEHKDDPTEAFQVAASTFDKWMSEDAELFSPPPLTCALMVGFWHRLHNMHKVNEQRDEQQQQQQQQLQQKPDFIENAIPLLSRFTVENILGEIKLQNPVLSNREQLHHPLLDEIDEPSYNALLRARSILLSEEYKPFIEEYLVSLSSSSSSLNPDKSKHTTASRFLIFPSPSYERILHHKELFAHRSKHWSQRREEIEAGVRSSLNRPSRQDYFPAFGGKSNLGLNDVVHDEDELRLALKSARLSGRHSYDGADVSNQRDGVVETGREGVYKMQTDKLKNHDSLFEDPRPGPFGANEKLNGWEYFKMGGQAIFPGDRASKVASPMHSVAPRRMKKFHNADRSWRDCTPKMVMKSSDSKYVWGKSI